MKKSYTPSDEIAKVREIKKTDVLIVRILILCGFILMSCFIWWFVKPDHIGNRLIFWLLPSALIFKLVKMLHEWYHYWSPSIPVPPSAVRSYTVDILTTSCPGEPRD